MFSFNNSIITLGDITLKANNLSLQKLAKLFSVSIDYLLGNDVENSQTADNSFTTEEIEHIKRNQYWNIDISIEKDIRKRFE